MSDVPLPGYSNVPDHSNVHEQSSSKAEVKPDEIFLDDLSASNRFMSYLLEKGYPIKKETSLAIGHLMSKFAIDVEHYEAQIKKERSWSKYFTRSAGSNRK